MKIFKKIGLSLSLIFLVSAGMLLFSSHKALAVTSSSNDIFKCVNNLKFVSIAEIDCTFTPDGQSSPVTDQFIDTQPDDGSSCSLTEGGQCPWHMNYKQQGDLFCEDGDVTHSSKSNAPGDTHYYDIGITIKGNGPLTPQDAGSSEKLVFNEGYADPNSTNCIYPTPPPNSDQCNGHSTCDKDNLPNKTASGSDTQGIAYVVQFTDGGIEPLSGVTKSSKGLTGNWSLTSYKSAGNMLAFVSGYTPGGSCSGDLIFINSGSNVGYRYTLNSDHNLSAGNGYDDLFNFLKDSDWGASGCGQNSGDRNFYGTTASFKILGSPPTAPSDQNTPDVYKNGGGGATGGDSCANTLKSPNPFDWALCPMLDIAQSFANGLINTFENQLSFTVDDLNGSQTCQKQVTATPNNTCQYKVERIWSIIRDLASAMLVIALLIMVISEAISWGPFDAYSIKKMMPRLVIAIILIQLSWPLMAWIVNLVDGVGKGLADLMYYPFGGSSNLDLGSLLANASIGTTTANSTAWGLAALAALGAITVISVAALPAVVFFLITAAFSLLTGLITLMFRKVLIIICLIFSPLAILAWVLPGTQSYFKLWRENFSKALMMFPLVVAMVAAGRIFAYITGTQDNGTASVLLNFIFIMVGYFGPLFILPKTFKWGGSLMSTVGGTIQSTIKPASEKSANAAKGHFERWQGAGAKQYNPGGPLRSRMWRRLQSGHILPTERSRRLAIGTGDKWATERNDEAEALVKRTGEKARDGYDRALTDRRTGEYVRVRTDADGNMLDAAGNRVTDWRNAQELYRGHDRSQATVEHLTGVEAEKQAYVDLAGNSGSRDSDKRAAQAAHKILLDTHSEIELQNARIQGGAHEGKRVFEVPTWDATLQGSPPHYSQTTKTRPDMAPDIKQSAEQELGFRYEDDITPAQREALDRVRMRITMERLDPETLQSAHYGLYDDIARIGNQQVVDEHGNLTGQTYSEMFAGTLRNFRDNAGQPGNVAVGSLRGAKESHVNAALAATGYTLDTLP